MLDSLVRHPDFHPGELTELPTRLRGLTRLRRLLGHADPRSESPWESILRLFHDVVEAPVESQYEVIQEGRFVARGDFRLAGLRVLHEYDGDIHLTVEQQRRDLARARRLDAAGWIRRGYTSYDLTRDPDGLLRDIDASLGRRRNPLHLRRWRDLLQGSCLTSTGRVTLARRLSPLPVVT
ncbi:hypothetical protein [Nocardioides daphniae]|nr:hypothetical protein [Nocardioides daphniae]